jgi:glycerol uptake facilitator-like aquaporin
MVNNKLFLLEFIGTFAIMFIVLYTRRNPIIVGVSLTFFIFLSMSMSFPGTSFNPAFSVGKVAVGINPIETLLPAILCQVLGALSAAEVYKRM